jgi:SAM-dependent methyltransferase
VERRTREWDEIASLDLEWSILSDPTRRHGGWTNAEFFETGRVEIQAALAKASVWSVPVHRRSALDFGCGVGRVSRALTAEFPIVLGVDVSRVMVSRARDLNAGIEGLSFEVLGNAGLRSYGDREFDLVYSRLVLQHITDSQLLRRTVVGLVRLLADGGLLVFQVPASIPTRRRLQLRPRLYSALRKVGISETVLYGRLGLHPIRMNSLDEHAVEAIVTDGGGELLHVERSRFGKPAIDDRVYWVTKPR